MNRKTIPLNAILALAMLAPTFAQVRTVEPTYVMVTAPKDELNIESVSAVKSELRSLRTVVIAMKSADFEIQLNALALNGCQGYTAAVLLTDRNTGAGILRAYTSATVEGLARQIVKDGRKDFEQRKNTWR